MPINVKSLASNIEKENLDWKAGSNELTELSESEQNVRLGVLVDEAEMQSLKLETYQRAAQELKMMARSFGAPFSYDWRNVSGKNYVTPVKNQGSCGSCVSFCTCSVIESAVRIRMNNPTMDVDLSEAFCQFCGGGSCGGWGLTSGLAFAKSTGVTDEACMPYQPTNMDCGSNRCSNWQSRLTKLNNYTAHSTMAARKQALVDHGPLVAGMAVYNDFFAYSSGVYVKTSGATLSGYHCISVVGYNDSQQCWILKNSWGSNWGDNGFCRIRYNQADVLIDTDWSFYSVDVQIASQWFSNVKVNQTYATHHAENAWVNIENLGWRRIKTGNTDGVTNMHALFSYASANNRKVTVYADADFVYRAYLL